MAVTVTLTAGTTAQVGGTAIGVDAGHLTVTDDAGTGVAVFAPGAWLSAEVTE